MKDLRSAFRSRVNRDYVMIRCPSPEHDDSTPSCALYRDHAYCYGCKRSFDYDELIHLLRLDEATLASQIEQTAQSAPEKKVSLSPVMIDVWHASLVTPQSPLAPRVNWLRERGIRLTTIHAAQIGHTGRYFSIPIRDSHGTLINVKFRRDEALTEPDSPKYTHLPGTRPFLYRPNPEGTPPVICEGELDTLLLAQYGVDAMTSTHGAGTLATVLAGQTLGKRVYIAVDHDDAGDAAYAAIVSRFRGDFRRIQLGAKDVTDALRGKGDYAITETLREWFQGSGLAS